MLSNNVICFAYAVFLVVRLRVLGRKQSSRPGHNGKMKCTTTKLCIDLIDSIVDIGKLNCLCCWIRSNCYLWCNDSMSLIVHCGLFIFWCVSAEWISCACYWLCLSMAQRLTFLRFYFWHAYLASESISHNIIIKQCKYFIFHAQYSTGNEVVIHYGSMKYTVFFPCGKRNDDAATFSSFCTYVNIRSAFFFD